MSGKTVEARDQVLIIFFWPAAFISSMRFKRRSSTNGPFFADLLKRCLLPYPRLPRLRPRMINLSDGLWLARVRYPSVGTPHGVTGCRPAVVLPLSLIHISEPPR